MHPAWRAGWSWPDSGPQERAHYDPMSEALGGAGVAIVPLSTSLTAQAAWE
ncbi:hypothetical protein [Streptomyces sp. NPDC054961]